MHTLYINVADFLTLASTGVIQPGDISGNDFLGNGIVQNSSDDMNLIMEGNWWDRQGGPLATQLQIYGTGTIDADPAADVPYTNGSNTPAH